jgi:hypothetical protein
MGRKLGAKPAQVEYRIDPPHQVIGRNTIFQANLVKQTVLPSQLLTHHGPNPVAESVRAKESRQATDINRVLQQPRL